MLPTVILPGYLAAASDYVDLERAIALSTKAVAVTVPLKRRDWFVTLGGRPVTPILEALDQSIQSVLEQTKSDKVNLIGHSAGGWISRIYLGDLPYKGRQWNGLSSVHSLITLGTPHVSQEQWTRENLDFVNQSYPGAFYSNLNYICIAGKSVYGKRSWRFSDWFTYKSYELTCGQGQAWGDGVTPIQSAHLEGGTNITLEGIMHSPRPKDKNSASSHQWYGSAGPLDQWVSYLS